MENPTAMPHFALWQLLQLQLVLLATISDTDTSTEQIPVEKII